MFNNLEEATANSKETHRIFFHKFILFGQSVLCLLHVSVHLTSEKARCTKWENPGMASCIGSMDATHMLCKHIPFDLQKEHKGHKQPGNACMHNIIVNNRRRILCTTKGHPAWWNNKFLVQFDKLALALWCGRNKVWHTCCASHNLAVEHDGMETVPEEQD